MPNGAFFETSRLIARPFTDEDLEPFVAYRQDPEVARHQGWSDYTLEEGHSLAPRSRRDGRAQRVVRCAAGARREAHFVENVFFKGSWGSEFSFAILGREWWARS